MSFEIKKFHDGNYDVVSLVNSQTNESVVVVPSLGGTVNQITLLDELGLRELLKVDEKHYTDNHSFRGRLLFPYNDRIPDAKYFYQGDVHHLPVNCPSDGSSIHGLIYNQEMKIESEACGVESAHLVLSFEIDDEAFAGYPFKVAYEAKYLLDANGFMISFKIKNLGQGVAPIALGWHPYFKIGEGLAGHSMTMKSDVYVAVDSDLIPTGEIPSVEGTELDFRNGASVETVELDHAISVPSDSKTVLEFEDRKLILHQDREFFKFVQVYIPDNRESIAIEPISGATDSFNRDGLGRKDLAPGEWVETWCAVSVK